MKKLKFCILSFIGLTLLTSCTPNDEKIEGLKPHEILVVTLEIADDIEVKQITLTSTGGIDKISGNQIHKKRKMKLKTPQRGEGSYSICVYTATDTLCSQNGYIEGGYRPKLKLKNSKFETVEWL